jgi:tetratricopeptide (TPR) repeat protein
MLLCVAPCCHGQLPEDIPATLPADGNILAAASLRHHAEHVSLFPDATGRTTRVRACLKFARKLEPGNEQVNRLLAGIYQSDGELEDECATVGSYLTGEPDDYIMSLRWLLLKRDLLNTAEERIKFYESVVARQSVPASVRAEALIEMAARLEGQGNLSKAREAVDGALRLDPYHPGALRARRNMLAKPTAADDVELMLGILAGSPADAQTAVRLADTLQSRGLHLQAISFFNHARQVAVWTDDSIALLATNGLCDAMLDAGQVKEAIKIIEPLRKNDQADAELSFKLVEAYRMSGEEAKADQLVADLTASYKPKEPTTLVLPAFARELAWFYLVVNSKPGYALAFARQARGAGAAADPTTKRNLEMLLGAAELKSLNVPAGEKRLWAVAGADVFASAFLAEHWYASGKATDARKTLLAGLSLGRGGWAYRRLRALAEQHKVQIPPMEGAEAIGQKLQQFDAGLLAPAISPESFLTVRLEPVTDRVAPCEPVEIRATLSNRGSVRVPLGTWGLLVPSLAVKVAAGAEKTEFADLPVARWPAPRYLMPGQSTTMQVRVDKGTLAQMLLRSPLDEITLTVTAVLSPTVRDKKLVSAAPTVNIQPVTITRQSLFSRVRPEKLKDMPAAYDEALGWIVLDIKRGHLSDRMRAARQVASLVDWATRIQATEIKPPETLTGKVNLAIIHRMLMEVLKDSSPAVRAELLAGLCDAKLDEETLKYLGPVIEDPDALVRLRMAELIGASNTRGRETIVSYLAQDKDDLVRLMASAFAGQK